MKGGVCREAKEGGVVDRYTGEGSGGVRSSEGLSRSSPAYLAGGLPGSGLPPSSATVHTPYTNDTYSHQGRVYGTCPQGRYAYQEPPDAQQTSESVGGKADSGSSSFASTPSKKPKADVKLRGSPVPKPEVKGDKFSTVAWKHSVPLSNDPEVQISVEQEMHNMRQTILGQEAVFREQVRELHRVHKVQTLLMEEMKKKDSDLLSFFSGTARGDTAQAPPDFASISSEGNRNLRSPLVGQFLENTGYNLQASIAFVEPLKGGAEITRSETDIGASTPEIKLFGGSERNKLVPSVRRTFDLERPPEDDDDEQERKLEVGVKSAPETIKFIGLTTTCSEPENEVSLNLSAGWDRRKVDRVRRDSLSFANEQDQGNIRVQKRPREMEEAPLLPLFVAKAETPARETPLRPTPKVANQNFLGGLFHLQLGRKEETSFPVDINTALQEPEVVKKPERLSLNLDVEEKTLPIASQAEPHWLFHDKPMKKAPCKTEAPAMSAREPFPPSRDQEILKFSTSSKTEEAGSSVLNEGSVWGGEQIASGDLPRSRPQASHIQRQADEGVQQGRGVYRTPFLAVGGTTSTVPGYTSYDLGQGAGEGPREGLPIYSHWRDGEGPKNGFPHGGFAPSHSLGPGGLPTLGVQLRSFDGYPSFASQGVVVGHPVNMGTGTAAFVGDSNSGAWYQQRSSYSQFQQYQQPQQLASLQQAHTASSQGPWQTPLPNPQGSPYPQGAVFAIPAGASSSIGLPLDGLRRMREDLPGISWPVGNVGTPFTTFSIVAPPKPPFKRPPKLVLTHDVTTMELKLVSPEKGGVKNLHDKTFSGSSEEEVGNPSRVLARRDNTSVDAGPQNRTLKDRDENHVGYQGGTVRYPRGGKRERDERVTSSPLIEKGSSPRGVGLIDKSAPSSHSRVLGGRNSGLAEGDTNVAHGGTAEGTDDADGSDGGSGGSGVGDVINPGERTSPPSGTTATAGNLPAGEGEEVLHLGELGIQADPESKAMKVDRAFKSGVRSNKNRTSDDDKPRKQQEIPEQLAIYLASNKSLAGRKVPRDSSDCSEISLKRMRLLHSSTEEGKQAPTQTSQHRGQEQSATSSGCVSNLPENGSRPHGLSPEFQASDELRNVQLELQRSSGSTSETRANLVKLQEACSHAVDRTKSKDGTGRPVVDMNVELTMGGISDDAEQSKAVASNFGDHMQEMKPDHSKQLSGASTSSPVGAEKGRARHNPHSPGLHQVPSLKFEDAEGQAEGSSIIVSQASETVQGNGRSPLRTGEWVGPAVMEQGHLGSSGGIKYSCEEVDGTLVERLRGGEMEQKGKDVCPDGNNSASCYQEDLGQLYAAAVDTTDPSSPGMCISQTTTKTSQHVKGDLTPGPGVSNGEKQKPESRKTTAVTSEVDEGETDISGLNKHRNKPAVQNTEKSEGSLDGDKDSVNSSKSNHEQDRTNGGNAILSAKVLPGHGATRSKKLQDDASKSKADLVPAGISACGLGQQSAVSSPMNRRVPAVAVHEEVDELSENPCENSNLAATLVLSLAPKGPSLSSSYSKAEKKRSLSILERSTDDGVHPKMEQHVVSSKVSRPDSSPLSSDLDSGLSASIKCQIGMQVSGISKENDRHTSLSRGEKTMIFMEPQSPPKLDFFESVTLMLKESKLLKDKPISGKDGQKSCDLLHPLQTTRSSGTKPLRKKKVSKHSPVDPGPKKLASRFRGSESSKTRELPSGCESESGFRLDNTICAETSNNRPGQAHGKNSGAARAREDIKCAISSQQVSSDQEGESSKGGDSSRGDSVDTGPQRSCWGDARRRKRMQRPRNAVHSQALKLPLPSRKVGH